MNDRRNIDRRFNDERREAGIGRRTDSENGYRIRTERRSITNRRIATRRLFHRREGWISI